MTSNGFSMTPPGIQDEAPTAESITSERIADAAAAMQAAAFDNISEGVEEVKPSQAEQEAINMAYSKIVSEVTGITSKGMLGMFAAAQLNDAGRQAFADIAHLFHFTWNAWCCNRVGFMQKMEAQLADLRPVADEDDAQSDADNLIDRLLDARNKMDNAPAGSEYKTVADEITQVFNEGRKLDPNPRLEFSLRAEIDAIERSLLRDQAAGLPVSRYDFTAVKKRLAEGATPAECYDDLPYTWQILDDLHKASISNGEYYYSTVANVLPRPGASILTPPAAPKGKRFFWGASQPEGDG